MSADRIDKARLFEAYLVAAARTGDAAARARLVAAWQPRLIGHAWRLTGDMEMAREAVQDGWVEILKGLPALRDEMAFPAWALMIITRRCRRLGGRRGRDRARETGMDDEMPLVASEDETGPDVLVRQHMRRAIDALPPDQRAALALVYLHELSVAEAALALDAPEGTIKTRLMHARRKLRDHLTLQGVTP
ncbi:RNA polymerase sigma factor [Brevundimonas halotolerans]|uniref:RNA polymerase sigma-70 factor (ECF subfamily) n=1 Tax=Brevundimonas halotolerans TaxID=69670 RepID=A0A7W9A2Q9_9CAUL|nr:RNA polymerase sigma factor [Brevundimonas halotolerans]MBB5660346.1 RNA polymerase sigma-70 factor (ECF subfamily) [Brevundimonas halotolerans]